MKDVGVDGDAPSLASLLRRWKHLAYVCLAKETRLTTTRRSHGDVSSAWAFPIHVELQSEIAIAASLKHSTQSEWPGNVLAAEKEIAHFHGIAGEPVGDDRKSKPFAGSCLVVLYNLWNWEYCLHRQSEIA